MQKNDLDVSNNIISSSAPNHDSGILGIANDNDLLGDPQPGPRPWAEWTPGTLVYGVDYDRNQAGNPAVPLDRFFKAVFWGIRDYVSNFPDTAPREWNVFLNNKTFNGSFTGANFLAGYNSYDSSRKSYLAMAGLHGKGQMPGAVDTKGKGVIIHLYGGITKNDSSTSTLDLSQYSASYALIDFGNGNSSIHGINFKNFDVNKKSSTKDSTATIPLIRLGTDPNLNPEELVTNCTFENITLNPKQSYYQVGNVGSRHFYYNSNTLFNLVKFVFQSVKEKISDDMELGRDLSLYWDLFLDNKTYDGVYGTKLDVDYIRTGYQSWSTVDNKERAKYITFRNYNPRAPNVLSENLNVTINLYGGKTKDDGLKSTIDLSQYVADYRFIDLSGGASTITGINFKNYNATKSNPSDTTSMPFIFLGDEKIQNNKSSLINCTFENITLNKKQPIVRMAYIDSLQDQPISESGGIIDGCVFKDNHASQMVAIAGSKSDGKHSDDGPIFYGFKANNNLFVNNNGTMEYNSNSSSLGLCMKIWNEAFNVTLNNNRFINNTNAVHGAAR